VTTDTDGIRGRADERAEVPIACSLDAGEVRTRTARWQALADAALVARTRTAGGARQMYRAKPGVFGGPPAC
jgi:hypothetical protein